MPDKKSARYTRLHRQLRELFNNNNDSHARMATMNALLYHKMDGFFWVGFYELKEGRLIVGPYQGPLACLELPENTGVCWSALNQAKTVVVPDVHRFAGHIACDSRSKSEIALPVRDRNNSLTGVLDIDSNLINHFDNTDVEHLEKLITLLYE